MSRRLVFVAVGVVMGLFASAAFGQCGCAAPQTVYMPATSSYSAYYPSTVTYYGAEPQVTYYAPSEPQVTYYAPAASSYATYYAAPAVSGYTTLLWLDGDAVYDVLMRRSCITATRASTGYRGCMCRVSRCGMCCEGWAVDVAVHDWTTDGLFMGGMVSPTGIS